MCTRLLHIRLLSAICFFARVCVCVRAIFVLLLNIITIAFGFSAYPLQFLIYRAKRRVQEEKNESNERTNERTKKQCSSFAAFYASIIIFLFMYVLDTIAHIIIIVNERRKQPTKEKMAKKQSTTTPTLYNVCKTA